jgi:hypothetical protein
MATSQTREVHAMMVLRFNDVTERDYDPSAPTDVIIFAGRWSWPRVNGLSNDCFGSFPDDLTGCCTVVKEIWKGRVPSLTGSYYDMRDDRLCVVSLWLRGLIHIAPICQHCFSNSFIISCLCFLQAFVFAGSIIYNRFNIKRFWIW